MEIKKRLNTRFKRCNNPNCRRRNMLLSLGCFFKGGGRFKRRAQCKECHLKSYGHKLKEYSERRKRKQELIPNNLSEEDKLVILASFDNKCSITGSEDEVTLDHFVPIAWGSLVNKFGIGGNTFSNMIPMTVLLNKSKSAHNPFEWFEEVRFKHNLDVNNWNNAVEYIAAKHKMSRCEYEMRVNHCFHYLTVRQHIFLLNKILKEKRKNPPYHMLKRLLKLGVIINIAVEKYGTKAAKDFIDNKETMVKINEFKKLLTLNTL